MKTLSRPDLVNELIDTLHPTLNSGKTLTKGMFGNISMKALKTLKDHLADPDLDSILQGERPEGMNGPYDGIRYRNEMKEYTGFNPREFRSVSPAIYEGIANYLESAYAKSH